MGFSLQERSIILLNGARMERLCNVPTMLLEQGPVWKKHSTPAKSYDQSSKTIFRLCCLRSREIKHTAKIDGHPLGWPAGVDGSFLVQEIHSGLVGVDNDDPIPKDVRVCNRPITTTPFGERAI